MNGLFKNLDDIAIKRLKTFEPPEGYWVAYSGGKDSDVILNLVRKSGVRYEAHHSLTTADPPEVVNHVKEQSDVTIDRPKRTMWELIKYNGMPPRRNARYCCRTQKESGGEGRIVVTGLRRAEGANRSKRRMVEQCYYHPTTKKLNIIVDWSTTDVWRYIKDNNIKYCCLYDEGFSRLGCVLCPSKRDIWIDFERWPQICNAWERAIKATFKRGNQWKNPEEYWQWWLDRDAPSMKYDQMQMMMFTD